MTVIAGIRCCGRVLLAADTHVHGQGGDSNCSYQIVNAVPAAKLIRFRTPTGYGVVGFSGVIAIATLFEEYLRSGRSEGCVFTNPFDLVSTIASLKLTRDTPCPTEWIALCGWGGDLLTFMPSGAICRYQRWQAVGSAGIEARMALYLADKNNHIPRSEPYLGSDAAGVEATARRIATDTMRELFRDVSAMDTDISAECTTAWTEDLEDPAVSTSP